MLREKGMQKPFDPSRFLLSATCCGEARSATRTGAASITVLADTWALDGCEGIQITDKQGRVHTREAFRATLPLTRQVKDKAPSPGLLRLRDQS